MSEAFATGNGVEIAARKLFPRNFLDSWLRQWTWQRSIETWLAKIASEVPEIHLRIFGAEYLHGEKRWG